MVNRGWFYLGNLLFNTTTKSKGYVHTGLVFGGKGSWIQRAHHSDDWISTSLLSQGYLHITIGYEPWQKKMISPMRLLWTWERSDRSHVITWGTVGNDWGWGGGFTNCSQWSWWAWRWKTMRKWRSCMSWLLIDKLCWSWSSFFL